ncbi:MAG: hypothetical protein ACRCU1_19230, partial [Alsobacter sp.]
MATQPKITDPTEAALSAIQEALNLTDTARTESGSDAGSKDAVKEPRDFAIREQGAPSTGGDQAAARKTDDAPRMPDVEDAAFGEVKVEKPRDRARPNREPVPSEPRRPAPGRAANDDRRAVGEILQALSKRPSRMPYVLATLASALWLAALALYAGMRWGLTLTPDDSMAARLVTPEAALIAFAAIAPVVVLFVLAILYTRAQEMRSVARSMTQVALRLAAPETAGSDGFVSL